MFLEGQGVDLNVGRTFSLFGTLLEPIHIFRLPTVGSDESGIESASSSMLGSGLAM